MTIDKHNNDQETFLESFKGIRAILLIPVSIVIFIFVALFFRPSGHEENRSDILNN